MKGYKDATAKSYVSGISFYLKINGWVDTTETFIVKKKCWKVFTKKHESQDLRAPVTLDMLKSFPHALKNVAISNYEALLFTTAFSVAFFGFMRIGGQDSEICPVSLLRKYLQQRPSVSGPLLCLFNGQAVTRWQFAVVLSWTLNFLDIKEVIRSHSFRIGAATLSSSQSISDAEIKTMGRWSEQSTAFKRYIRLDKIKA